MRAGLRLERFDLRGSEVDCWLGGEGPPLLLLHGFGASAVWQWHGQVSALARRYSLIVPDLPFFGRSTTRSPDRTLGFQVELVLSLLDRLAIAHTDVVGLSYGGFVSYLLAARAPDRFGKLVMTSCPGPVITPDDHRILLERLGVGAVDELLLPDGPDGVRRLLDIAYHRPPYVPRFALADVHARLFTQNVEEKRALIRALLGELGAERDEAALRHRILVIAGEHDPIFPVELARRFVERAGPSAHLVILPHAAHAPNLERAREYNRLLLDFLAI